MIKKSGLLPCSARFKDPRRFLVDFSIRLDDLRERISRALRQRTQLLQNKLQHLELGLQSRNPERQIREKRIFLNNLEKDVTNGWKCYLRDREERLNKNAALLSSLSPLAVLQRGYSITRRLSNGEIVRQASQLALEERVSIQLAEGGIQARVEKTRRE